MQRDGSDGKYFWHLQTNNIYPNKQMKINRLCHEPLESLDVLSLRLIVEYMRNVFHVHLRRSWSLMEAGSELWSAFSPEQKKVNCKPTLWHRQARAHSRLPSPCRHCLLQHSCPLPLLSSSPPDALWCPMQRFRSSASNKSFSTSKSISKSNLSKERFEILDGLCVRRSFLATFPRWFGFFVPLVELFAPTLEKVVVEVVDGQTVRVWIVLNHISSLNRRSHYARFTWRPSEDLMRALISSMSMRLSSITTSCLPSLPALPSATSFISSSST